MSPRLKDLPRTYLLALWINILLYSVELVMAFLYFNRYRNDTRIIRFMIISLVLADTVGTIAACATAWLSVITYSNVPINYNFWTAPIRTFASAISATLERSFLVYRVLSISGSKLICGFLMILVVIQSSFCMIAGIAIAIQPEFKSGLVTIVTTISFCFAVAVDFSIAVALIWQLNKFTSIFESTKSLIRRITIQAISTGSFVAVINIVFIILFWTASPEFLILSGILGRLYLLTVLVILFARSLNASGSATVMEARVSNMNFHTTSPRIEDTYWH